MTVSAYNKVLRTWASTVDGSDLPGPIENWILNPVFENEALARQMGPEFWVFDETNVIHVPPVEQYNATMLERARAAKWKEIQDYRDYRTQNGGYKVGNNWFHSDVASRIQQLGLLIMGANMPAGIMWKTMGGSFVQMTPTLAQQIFQAAGASDMATFAIAEQHRAQMMVAPDPKAYDFKNTNPPWPKIFGE